VSRPAPADPGLRVRVVTVDLIPPRPGVALRAVATIRLGRHWLIRGVRVLATPAGDLRVTVPAARDPRRHVWQDICFPTTRAARAALDAAVLAAYSRALEVSVTPAPTLCKEDGT
jgi:DNA-binding cell septation regulator SpoVG